MNGADNGATFPDSSPTATSVYRSGSVVTKTGTFKYGGASAYFDGSSYLYGTPSDASAFDFGRSDFSIESWVNFDSLSDSPTLLSIGTSSSNRLDVYWSGGYCKVKSVIGGTATDVLTSSVASNTGAFEFWSLDIVGGVATLRKDGVTVASITNADYFALGNGCWPTIGYQGLGGGSSANYLRGFVDDLRILRLVAAHSADFTPPTAELPIAPGRPVTASRFGSAQVLGSGNPNRVSTPAIQKLEQGLIDRVPFGLPITTSELGSPGSAVPAQRPWQTKGRGRVAGTVKEKATPSNVPVHRRVRLYRELDGQLVCTVWSDPITGAYEFYGVPLGVKFTVISHDYAGIFRAVLADNIEAEVIP